MSRSRARRSNADTPFDAQSDFEACGEKPAARRRRLSAKTKSTKRTIEVDRSGSVRQLERAAKRLRAAKVSERILRVPQWDMDAAVVAMRHAGVTGVVTNLCGSRRVRVETRR